ncbi:hypothetical protein NE237_008249 [Protea cynaroides]|uniref:Uncharacterized protein n=1 Tax=Protea cynaroides TaxID=273540 RepID=A0A9Q0GLJ1_9MAGN|nr:hypothetical protein NE237_008249 [Protea cynaroides]
MMEEDKASVDPSILILPLISTIFISDGEDEDEDLEIENLAAQFDTELYFGPPDSECDPIESGTRSGKAFKPSRLMNYFPGMGLGKRQQGILTIPDLHHNEGRYGLGYIPTQEDLDNQAKRQKLADDRFFRKDKGKIGEMNMTGSSLHPSGKKSSTKIGKRAKQIWAPRESSGRR